MGLFGRQALKVCWVRSDTDDPCGRPAAVEILGVPFCERCAREHEEYAAIGALTEPIRESDLGGLREASLIESLRKLRSRRSQRAAPRDKALQGQKV